MDESVGSSSTVVMLSELLSSEKDVTRVWLRAEMDRLVDPMLDSIFDRLTTKLTNGLERKQSGNDGDWAQVKNPTAPDQMSNVHLFQPSTSFLLNQQLTMNYESQPLSNGPIPFDSQFTVQLSSTSPVPPPVSITNSQIILPDELANSESHQIKHKIEITNESTHCNDIANEQSNHNSNDPNWDEDEDEEECDCEDCVNGGIEFKEEDEDDDVQLIDELPRPVKRPRLDSAQPINSQQPEVIQQCSSQPTDESQPNQVNNNKQIITLHLQCPRCPNTFPEDQFNQHILGEHSIGPFQCLVKDCVQSFNTKYILQRHIKQSHQHTTQWHCDKCAKHFAKYEVLLNHNYHKHQLGLFQCTFPSCTFTGECRIKVYNHYQGLPLPLPLHKTELVCQQSDCLYRTRKVSDMQAHQRAHLGIKPYRCKWLNCGYASSYQQDAVKHIRRMHFAGGSSNGQQLGEPKDYLEVMHQL